MSKLGTTMNGRTCFNEPIVRPQLVRGTFSGAFFLFFFFCSSALAVLVKLALTGSQPPRLTGDRRRFPASRPPQTAAHDSSSSRPAAAVDRMIHVGYSSGSRPRSTPNRVRRYPCPEDSISFKRLESSSAFCSANPRRFPAIFPNREDTSVANR